MGPTIWSWTVCASGGSKMVQKQRLNSKGFYEQGFLRFGFGVGSGFSVISFDARAVRHE